MKKKVVYRFTNVPKGNSFVLQRWSNNIEKEICNKLRVKDILIFWISNEDNVECEVWINEPDIETITIMMNNLYQAIRRQ